MATENDRKMIERRASGVLMVPTLEMPTIPEYLKHKPEYRTAWIEYERKLDEWRKTLQTQIGAAASVTSEALRPPVGGPGPEPAP